MALLFQYISCYGLSILSVFDDKVDNRFQYISCYGLSARTSPKCPGDVDFNTSHVTVYLPENRNTLSYIQYFNTSHVTVYRAQNLGR